MMFVLFFFRMCTCFVFVLCEDLFVDVVPTVPTVAGVFTNFGVPTRSTSYWLFSRIRHLQLGPNENEAYNVNF
jgi:hypothetical protein